YTVQASSGSLTMQFSSDGNVENEGFYGFWECSSQPCEPLDLITVTNTVDPTSIEDAISTPLTLVEVDNIECADGSIGTFDMGDNTNLGLNRGIVLSSGSVTTQGFNNGIDNPGTVFASTAAGAPGDPDLDYLSTQSGGQTSNDACVLEVDVFVATDELRFEYVFGSEEYPEFVGSGFNDIFALLISGPGIVGDPNIANQENLAVLPAPGTGPVEINNVNNLDNWEFYRNNADGPSVVYDGLTSDYLGVKKSLTAVAQVVPCTTYHLKFAVADRGDSSFDSGVFISELTGGIPTIDVTYNNGIDYLVEECTLVEDEVVIGLATEQDEPVTYSINIGGTATPAVDYTLNIPAQITFQPGETEFSFPILALPDGIPEGTETIEISLTANFGCGEVIFTTLVIEITDELEVEINTGVDTAFVCQGGSVQLFADGAQNYFWAPPTIFNNPALAAPIATPTNSLDVFVVGSLGVCQDIDTINLQIVDPGVEIFPLTPTNICLGDSVVLSAVNNVGNAGLNWTPPINISDPNAPVVVVSPTVNTTYTVGVELEGCAAEASIDINVDPFDFPIVAEDTTLCQNFSVQLGTDFPGSTTNFAWTPIDGLDDPTSPNPLATPDVTTTYILNASSANDYCAQSDTVTVTVIPADVNIIEPEPVDTLFICLGEELDLTALTTTQGVGFEWISVDGNVQGSTDTSLVIAPTETTLYTASLVVGACNVLDSILIRVDSIPETALSELIPDKETYCEGELITMVFPTYEPANFPDIEHIWTPETGLQSPDTLWNLVITAVETTTYQRITTNNACIDTVEVEIFVVPTAEIFLEPEQADLCEGESIELTLVTPDDLDEVTWSPEAFLDFGDCDENCLQATLTPVLDPTTVSVEAEFDGCPVSASATINVTEIQGLQVLDASICPGETVVLNDIANITQGANFSWSVDGSVVSTDFSFAVSPTETTTYDFFFEINGCTVEESATVTVLNEEPSLGIISDTTICAGELALITAIPSSAASELFWTPGDLQGPSHEVQPATTTVYEATAVIGCFTVSNSMTVTVIPSFTLDSLIVTPSTAFAGSTIVAEAFTTPAELNNPVYEWTVNDAQITADNPYSFVATLNNPGTDTQEEQTVQVVITDEFGCQNSASAPIVVEIGTYEIPNIFSPNGDRVNDNFKILKTEDITILEFKVYDRFGQLVYDNENGDEGWDGTFNGKPMPMDVYAYFARILLPDGTEVDPIEKGEVTLLR
ncbi:MAG: choice-of-anchor L domain-containing protein, partial [Bacteroidota bacterium]